ncbi:MAG TPA: hypothetical protein VF515_09430 [Candidatus Binatia bacterium]
MNEKLVSVFPAVQHRHADGDIVTVTLRRKDGNYSADCLGCQTRFIYQKPAPSQQTHHKSPLLPEVKGNFDNSEG